MNIKRDDLVEIDDECFEPFDSKLGIVQYVLAVDKEGNHRICIPKGRVDVAHRKRGLPRILELVGRSVEELRESCDEKQENTRKVVESTANSPKSTEAKKQIISLQCLGDVHTLAFTSGKPGGGDIPCDEDELTLKNPRTLE